ncbi:MAG: aldose 1-epimerase [Calditrichaeota bacterium]|nr:aldose 1-epimerase [Calditrichota bacterium]
MLRKNVLLLAGLALLLVGGCSKAEKPKFLARVVEDPATGWHIVTLAYHADDPSEAVEVKICPEGGSNMFSFKYGGVELLRQPDSLRQLQGRGYGTLILYPTPNRVRNAQFVWEGRTYRFKPNWHEHFIHGLVLDKAWSYEAPVVTDTAATVRTWIDFAPGTPQYKWFPWQSRLSLTFTLTPRGLRITYEVSNRDKRTLPYGFATHPYFNLLGKRDSTLIWVPAKALMKAVGLLPTGKLEPLDGTPYDVRKPTPLSQLDLDDVFWGMTPEEPMGWEARDRGIRMVLPASRDFTHAVVYTPPTKPLFCMENQTCSTDAHNLYVKGFVKESHLLIVQPGQKKSGWVMFVPSHIR